MNEVTGVLRLDKEGEHPSFGPWRRYACGEQYFFAYPGKEYDELRALEGKHARLEVKHESSAWKYVQGTARETPAPTTEELAELAIAESKARTRLLEDCVLEAVSVAKAVEGEVTFAPREIQKFAAMFYLERKRKRRRL